MNLYGLIGYPLGHSFSKKYFNDKFREEGLEDCFFELYPLETIGQFPALLEQHPQLQGLAVTIPYKEAVMPYMCSVTPEVEFIGALNCIEFLPEGLRGHNTDIIGFEHSFVPLLQHHHTKALVLGTGGESKAVQFVLKKLNIPFLVISRKRGGENVIRYEDIDEQVLQEYTIIINCTPIGMSPNEQEKPLLPYEHINFAHYLYDLVYKPAITSFLAEGEKRGATTKNGYDMLIIQAEENWKIWNEL